MTKFTSWTACIKRGDLSVRQHRLFIRERNLHIYNIDIGRNEFTACRFYSTCFAIFACFHFSKDMMGRLLLLLLFPTVAEFLCRPRSRCQLCRETDHEWPPTKQCIITASILDPDHFFTDVVLKSDRARHTSGTQLLTLSGQRAGHFWWRQCLLEPVRTFSVLQTISVAVDVIFDVAIFDKLWHAMLEPKFRLQYSAHVRHILRTISLRVCNAGSCPWLAQKHVRISEICYVIRLNCATDLKFWIEEAVDFTAYRFPFQSFCSFLTLYLSPILPATIPVALLPVLLLFLLLLICRWLCILRCCLLLLLTILSLHSLFLLLLRLTVLPLMIPLDFMSVRSLLLLRVLVLILWFVSAAPTDYITTRSQTNCDCLTMRCRFTCVHYTTLLSCRSSFILNSKYFSLLPSSNKTQFTAHVKLHDKCPLY